MNAQVDGGLRIEGLTKRYAGGLLANDGIDLTVRPGEVFGLLGPNGAGKTTLVKQIVGLLAPSAGRIALDGHDLVRDPATARERVAYLPQGALPIDSLRAGEAIELVGRIRGGDRASVRRRTAELIASLELGSWSRQVGMRLSGGVRRLIGFVMTCVRPGALVILDEPTNDVDPLRRRLLWKEIGRLAHRGVSVLLVTHNVLEAEQAVDRLAVIDGGRIVAEGTPSSLKAADRRRLRVRVNLTPGSGAPPLPRFVRRHTRLGRRLHLLIDVGDAVAAIGWAGTLMDEGVAEEYALGAVTLEDVYIRLIGRDDALDEVGDVAS